MVIEVRLNASLRRYRPSTSDTGIVAVDVPEGISLGELLDEMEMDTSEVGTMKVNGEESGWRRVLIDGDRVDLFPVSVAKA